MTGPDVIPATAEVIQRFYGAQPVRTQMAVAVVDGDRVLGVGGIYLHAGCWVMFSDMTDELRSRKRALVRAFRAVLAMTRGRSIPVVALADEYAQASGRRVDPDRLRFYEVLSLVKMIAIMHTGIRAFRDGRARDLRMAIFDHQLPFLYAGLAMLRRWLPGG